MRVPIGPMEAGRAHPTGHWQGLGHQPRPAAAIDVQTVTPRLASLGARGMPRSEFLSLLARVRDQSVRLADDRLPVARLG
jgi:hypothetical protein